MVIYSVFTIEHPDGAEETNGQCAVDEVVVRVGKAPSEAHPSARHVQPESALRVEAAAGDRDNAVGARHEHTPERRAIVQAP